MHGAVRKAATWTWGVAGKHPVVKDYIRLGQDSPCLQAMSRWVEEGFHRVGGTHPRHSWRFFTRGGRPGELSYGLVRDSSDGAGRPFPLLIMGTGILDGWERTWELLPLVLDKAWGDLEYMSARRFVDLSEFKGDVMRLLGPTIPGKEVSRDHRSVGGGLPAEREGMTAVPLKGEGEHADEIAGLLLGSEGGRRALPGAVFMGGTASRSFLVVFGRDLTVEDFVTLWSMG